MGFESPIALLNNSELLDECETPWGAILNKADAEIALAETLNDMAEELRLMSRSSAP